MAFGITVDKKPLEDGNKAADAFKNKLTQVGAAIAGAFAFDKIVQVTKATLDAADAVDEQAQRLGISSRALEEWTYAAKFAGLAGDALDGVFLKLSLSAEAGADKTSEQGKALKKLGVDLKDANGQSKNAGQLFEEIGLALGGLQNGTEKTALAMQFFGKGAAARVLQLFKDGPEGIKKLRAEFEALGGGFGEFAQEAAETNDRLDRLGVAWLSARARIVGLFLPALNWLTLGITKVVAYISKLSRETYVLESTLAVFAATAASLAAPIIAAWWPVLLPFIKWAAVLAFAVLLVEDLIVTWKGGDSVIGRIIDRLFGPGSTAKAVAWCKETGEAFAKFFGDLTERPDEFAKNWKAASNSIQNDLTQSLGPTFGGWAAALIDEFAFVMTTFTGGWENFKEKWSAVGDGIVLAFKIAWDEIKFFGLGVVASLDDAITKLIRKIPGGLLDSLGGSGTASEDIRKLREKSRFALAAEGDAIGNRLNAPAAQRPAPAYGAGLVGPPVAGGGTPALQQDIKIEVKVGGSNASPYEIGKAVKRAIGAPNRAASASFRGIK